MQREWASQCSSTSTSTSRRRPVAKERVGKGKERGPPMRQLLKLIVALEEFGKGVLAWRRWGSLGCHWDLPLTEGSIEEWDLHWLYSSRDMIHRRAIMAVQRETWQQQGLRKLTAHVKGTIKNANALAHCSLGAIAAHNWHYHCLNCYTLHALMGNGGQFCVRKVHYW